MKPFVPIPGYSFDGLSAGIKASKRTKDMGIILSHEPKTTIAGVFTTNKACAAPVRFCRKQLKKHSKGRLILVNSGNANAATGKAGTKNTEICAYEISKHLGIPLKETYICSTGRIGEPLPMKTVLTGIARLKPNSKSSKKFAEAILTTDNGIKTVGLKDKLNGQPYHIQVIAKGAGMIEPNMATMLCFVVTDLELSQSRAQKLLKSAVDKTLNCLTVDGDMSTNDTVLLMANGLAKNKAIKPNSKEHKQVEARLVKLLGHIAETIALDGEGASKSFKVLVKGAKSKAEGQLIARAIANSQLVKTAMFGNDPNWGRILCAAGYSGARITEAKTSIKIGTHILFKDGVPQNKNEKPAARYLSKSRTPDIKITVGIGKGEGLMYASDLTYDYVRLNAEYHT